MPKANKEELTTKQQTFCQLVVEGMSILQAYKTAGYGVGSSDESAQCNASRLLRSDKVKKEIARLQKLKEDKSIATAQEVMQYFTRVMRGEIKDQFGIEASLSERTKAGMELAKRTVDLDNRAKGVADNKIEISLDWKR